MGNIFHIFFIKSDRLKLCGINREMESHLFPEIRYLNGLV